MVRTRIGIALAGLIGCSAQASESISYTYNTLGRLKTT
jgi:hypothetical protein